jgi:hypothetical protein
MPQHGDYDQENLKWFCSKWIDKRRWLEIHGYTPISTITESEEYEGVECN